jgi:hypothetical protein
MKTTILTRLTVATMLVGAGLIYSCSKTSSNASGPGTGTESAAELKTSSDDQSQVSFESDNITDDVNNALNASYSASNTTSLTTSGSGRLTTFGGGTGSGVIDSAVVCSAICDATITYADSNGIRSLTITYNGQGCNAYHSRSGSITVSIPDTVRWKDAGAQVTVTLNNVKITRTWDKKVITLNGTKVYTNVSGGLLSSIVGTQNTITHTITGNMSVTFPNGQVRTWSEAKERVWSYNDGFVATTTGTHTDSLSNSNVAEWGTDRYGTGFESEISQPKVIAESCDWRLTSGQNTIIRTDNIQLVITYGLDANGNATTCPGSGTYYFEIVATKGSLSYTYILPY